MAFNMSVLFLRQVNKSVGVFQKVETISSNNTVFKQNNLAFLAVVQQQSRFMSKKPQESDSDSDTERGKPVKGSTEFWRLKIRTLHSVYDLDKDGVVGWKDFCTMGDRFIKLGRLPKSQHENFRNTLKSVWMEQWGPADPRNMVNVHQYMDNMHRIINDKDLRKEAHRFLPFLFKAVDKDQSGEISVEEFKIFFKCMGLKEKDAVTAFQCIDTNNDNCLSEEEFVKLGREYLLSADEKKPSRNFWGPLLKK